MKPEHLDNVWSPSDLSNYTWTLVFLSYGLYDSATFFFFCLILFLSSLKIGKSGEEINSLRPFDE